MLRDGARLALPLIGDLEGDLESEEQERRRPREKLGVNPMDIAGVMGINVARP